jgi:hypothetical protein
MQRYLQGSVLGALGLLCSMISMPLSASCLEIYSGDNSVSSNTYNGRNFSEVARYNGVLGFEKKFLGDNCLERGQAGELSLQTNVPLSVSLSPTVEADIAITPGINLVDLASPKSGSVLSINLVYVPTVSVFNQGTFKVSLSHNATWHEAHDIAEASILILNADGDNKMFSKIGSLEAFDLNDQGDIESLIFRISTDDDIPSDLTKGGPVPQGTRMFLSRSSDELIPLEVVFALAPRGKVFVDFEFKTLSGFKLAELVANDVLIEAKDTSFAPSVDLNDNNVSDIAVLSDLSNDKQAIVFYDALTGAQTGAIFMPSWFSASQSQIIADTNSNGENDIIVLGEKSDGKKAWLVFDSKTRKRLNGLTFPAWFRPNQLLRVKDYSGNTKDEILTYGQTSDGKNIWMLHDSGTNVEYSRYIYPRWFAPASLDIVSDVNGNTKPEIISEGTTSDAYSAWILHDLHTKAVIHSKKINLPSYRYASVKSTLISDISGNGFDDYVWFSKDTKNDALYALGNDIKNGDTLLSQLFSENVSPINLTMLKDIDGNGFDEIALLVENQDGSKMWYRYGANYHTTLGNSLDYTATYSLPNLFNPTDINALPDVNGDAFEDILIRGTNNEGKVVLMIQDGVTGYNIRQIVLPSWLTPITIF